MFYKRLVLFCFSFCLTSIVLANDLTVYVDTFSHAYSETAPVKRIVFDDMKGDGYQAGNHSFTHNRWELGAKHANYDGWKAAYLIRYDYYLNYTEDTAELIYADKNDISIEKNRQYDVWLEAVHARTTGLKLGYEWQIKSDLSAEFDLSFLQAKRFIDGELQGNFTVLQDDYSGQIELDYVHDKDRLLKSVVDKTAGYGYALDMKLNWQIVQSWGLTLETTDILSTIFFDEAPFTTATATSNRVNFDPGGKIDVKPALTGRLGYRKHKLVFPRQLKLVTDYTLNDELNIFGQVYRYDDLTFPAVGFTQKLSPELALGGEFEFISNAVTLRMNGHNWSAHLTSDDIQLEQAFTFGLGFSYYWRF